VKFLFVAREKAHYAITILCRVLEVSTSGYYRWRRHGPSARERQDAELLSLMRTLHQASRRTYGVPRMHAELTLGQGFRCSRKRVARLMRMAGLVGIHRRRFRGITRRDPRRPVYPDLVQRQFNRAAPNQLWMADLTQHRTGEGWLYIGVELDAFGRRLVGWSTSDRPDAALAVDALTMAVRQRRPRPGVVHHSDHGAQYTSLAFERALHANGLRGSMGHIGSAYDNAVAESFFASLQTELLDRQFWPTRQALRSAFFSYAEGFYNTHRRHLLPERASGHPGVLESCCVREEVARARKSGYARPDTEYQPVH